jgi:hypothetical protein
VPTTSSGDPTSGMQPDAWITLAEAFRQFNVPIATLRYWLMRKELHQRFDDHQRVIINVGELQDRMARSGRDYRQERP